ncbi:IS1249 family transposase [Bifidobacterium sp. 82T24]|uniref:IS1249 family transposase n=1 Tax=Bifidobacterium pluvialisilvae TaxID=2834436 RepID=UPI001C58D4E7|nr:IS1249 family transposase [Bifidobacterium pluvialisilvae]MBW3089111.1 IS1249 family transposase [Bifidobacterium pluvialisilvae]
MSRPKSSKARRCPVCGRPMRKKGFTKAGAQRWKCDACRLSSTMQREDSARMAEFRAFIAWITGKRSMSEAAAGLGLKRREFARRIAWCWNVEPSLPPVLRVHRYVMADGTYVPYGWCLLIATGDDGRPLAMQWCSGETTMAYRRLFAGVERPGLLVCDGGQGCLTAAETRWKGIPVQRCLVHALRNTRVDLTNRPKSEAGRTLLELARRLTKVKSADEAAAWLTDLNRWHGKHGDYLKERTRAADDPVHARGRKWWWTHERLRRAYFRLVKLNRDGMLFAFCDPDATKDDGALPSTTNQLEGGVNAVVKRTLDHHRGLSEAHMRRCCEWTVYMLTKDPDPMSLITPEHWKTTSRKTIEDDGPEPGTMTDVQLPATGVDAYESGFGIRTGWAGRSH